MDMLCGFNSINFLFFTFQKKRSPIKALRHIYDPISLLLGKEENNLRSIWLILGFFYATLSGP